MMKKLLFSFLTLLVSLIPYSVAAQQGEHSHKFTIAGPDAAINLINTQIAWHQLTWSVSGTASACTVALDSSSNGTTWTAGGVISGQTCTSNGSSAVVNQSVNYVRIDMTSLTISGGGSVTVTWSGWTSNPAPPSGGVTSLNGLTGALSITAGTPNVIVTPSGSTIALSVASANQSAGSFTLSTACNGQVNCYQVHADAQIATNATYTASSASITTGAADPPFCGGSAPACTADQIARGHTTDVGLPEFGTYNCNANSEASCFYNCPQGTILAVTGAHTATLSAVCTNSSSVTLNSNNFVWGHDDSTNLTAAFQAMVVAAKSYPTFLQLPCGSMAMLSASFVDSTVGVRRYSMGINGCGPGNPTMIIPYPKMDCSTTTAEGCLLYDPFAQNVLGQISMTDRFTNILFYSAGLDDADSGATVTTGTSGIYVQFLSVLDNVWVEGWLWNRASATPVYGINCTGCTMIGSGSYAGGNYSCKAQGVDSTVASIIGGSCGGSEWNSLTIGADQVETSGVYLNLPENGNYTTAVDYTVYNAGGLWTDHGSFAGSVYNAAGGTSKLFGTKISSNTVMYDLYVTGGSVYLSGVTTIDNCNQTGGSIYDSGGNSTTTSGQALCPTGLTQSGGNWFGSPSITGTVLTTGKLALSGGWGSGAAVSAPAGATSPVSFTITNGTSTSATPTVTYTFPTTYMQAPLWCTATQIGGTNPVGLFTNGTPTTTSVVFTYSSITPTDSDTELVRVECKTQ